jgi:hypothetical protein
MNYRHGGNIHRQASRQNNSQLVCTIGQTLKRTYLAAWDVHSAKVFGRCEVKNGMAPVERLPFKWTFTRRDLHALLAKIATQRLAPAA